MHGFREEEGRVRVLTTHADSGAEESHEAAALVLAAGTLGTAWLVLRSLERYDTPVPLLSGAYTYVPTLNLARLGRPEPGRRHSLAQLTAMSLPDSETEFLDTLKIYFPNLYDIKYLMLSTDNLMGGLQSVANKLKVKRIGSQHQAGSDSLLTGQVFFKIYDKYFSHGLDDVKFSGQICGFNSCMPAVSSSSYQAVDDPGSAVCSSPARLQ